MPLTNAEAEKIAKLLIDNKSSENAKKNTAAGFDRSKTDTERAEVKELLKTKSELEAIQQRMRKGEQFSPEQQTGLSTALSFIASVINEKNAQSRPKRAITSNGALEEKKLAEDKSMQAPKSPSPASGTIGNVPVSGLPSYEQVTAKAVSSESQESTPQDWRANAQKQLKNREKMRNEFISLMFKLGKEGRYDPAAMTVVEEIQENFYSMERIIESPPTFFAERTFNSAMQHFDKNSVKLMNMTGLAESHYEKAHDDWLKAANKVVKDRSKMLSDYIRTMHKKGIKDTKIKGVLEDVVGKFQAMEKIINARPESTERSLFKSAVAKFDHSIVELINVAKLEKIPEKKPELQRKETKERKEKVEPKTPAKQETASQREVSKEESPRKPRKGM